jgi:hypothetical protein
MARDPSTKELPYLRRTIPLQMTFPLLSNSLEEGSMIAEASERFVSKHGALELKQ